MNTKEEKEGKKRMMEQEEAVKTRMEKVKHKIMVMSGKGGVGKTTVAANLAFALGMRGLDVGLMDADIHGPDIPKILGIEDKRPEASGGKISPILVTPRLKTMSIGFLLPNRDSAIIWRGPMKMNAIRQFLADVDWGELDYMVIDLPPGTGDEPLSVAQLIKNVDGTIIVTTPQDLALLDSRKAVNFSGVLKVPVIGIIENMSGFVCPYCGKEINIFKYGGGERSATELGVPFLGRVPLDPKMVEAADSGTPFVLQKESKVREAFEQIVENVRAFVEGEKENK
ncbi:MAG: Mrp/NBP35 family ATP-binding protein [Methanophagales archaeon]|nr:Mrp/NBP35 family ATP-binding protein [Methanophagales archaeon]MCW3141660.1 Mrp/NBP35 family ATP-binding protein [Methanophagales archaeon]